MQASRMPRAGNLKDRAETIRAARPHPPVAFWACCWHILGIPFELLGELENEATLVPQTNRISSRIVPPMRGSVSRRAMDRR
jgi:hypothetical protein